MNMTLGLSAGFSADEQPVTSVDAPIAAGMSKYRFIMVILRLLGVLGLLFLGFAISDLVFLFFVWISFFCVGWLLLIS